MTREQCYNRIQHNNSLKQYILKNSGVNRYTNLPTNILNEYIESYEKIFCPLTFSERLQIFFIKVKHFFRNLL